MGSYIKVNLVGDNDTVIIAEIINWYEHKINYNELEGPYASYGKARDAVTGVPLIIDCKPGFEGFKHELYEYGRARKKCIGAVKIASLSDKDALDFLKNMTEDDVKKYTDAIRRGIEQHITWLKMNNKYYDNHINKRIDNYLSLRLNKRRIRKMAQGQMLS